MMKRSSEYASEVVKARPVGHNKCILTGVEKEAAIPTKCRLSPLLLDGRQHGLIDFGYRLWHCHRHHETANLRGHSCDRNFPKARDGASKDFYVILIAACPRAPISGQEVSQCCGRVAYVRLAWHSLEASGRSTEAATLAPLCADTQELFFRKPRLGRDSSHLHLPHNKRGSVTRSPVSSRTSRLGFFSHESYRYRYTSCRTR
jgi:hypothetical protein